MAQSHGEEARGVEEDLVKSFFPSLFDSDSDSEDVYCLRSNPSDDVDAPSSELVSTLDLSDVNARCLLLALLHALNFILRATNKC